MKIKRVEHIAIAVNSLNQSLNLLRDTFGIREAPDISPARLRPAPSVPTTP